MHLALQLTVITRISTKQMLHQISFASQTALARQIRYPPRLTPARKQLVRQPSPYKLPSAIDPALVDHAAVAPSLKSPVPHRRRKSSAAKPAGGFGGGGGNADDNDDDDFGDDFDDFEEGDEDADFGDFDDGFQAAEEAAASPPMHAPQPQVPIPSFVCLGPTLGSRINMLTILSTSQY